MSAAAALPGLPPTESGFQVTFFTQQDRVHDGQPLPQWLLEQARAMGIRGATVNGALQGLGHDGVVHAVNLFDYSDQPILVTLVMDPAEMARLFAHLQQAQVQVFYVRHAVEFGTLGRAPGS